MTFELCCVADCTLQGLVPILCSHDFIPECLSEQFICNGVEDCSTGLDEVDCGTITTCPNESQELPCSDLATLDCIPTDIICNGNPDCQTGLDEINCDSCRDGVTCEEDPAICISFDEICDGIAQCPGTDPIDEQFCNGEILCIKCTKLIYKYRVVRIHHGLEGGMMEKGVCGLVCIIEKGEGGR